MSMAYTLWAMPPLYKNDRLGVTVPGRGAVGVIQPGRRLYMALLPTCRHLLGRYETIDAAAAALCAASSCAQCEVAR